MTSKGLQPELLAITKRGDVIQSLHYGWICAMDQDKKITHYKGNIQDPIFLRSSAKPIQAIPVVENNIKVTNKELAIICGSHSGSKQHIKLLNNLIKKNKLHLSDLRCGSHLPFDEEEKTKLIAHGLSPSPLYNNCSGKHLGMLSVCKKNNWDSKTYLKPDHPIQKTILSNIEELSETKKISLAIDGCGVPTFALPVINIAKMFSNFTRLKNKSYTRIISAMTGYPFFVGGYKELDTEIMKLSRRKLIAKSGAEGIITVATVGSCVVVKIADGSPHIRSFIILKLLTKLNWLNESKVKDSCLRHILNGEIKNHAGTIVGETIATF